MSTVKSITAICPECGTPNPASARFCANCAARLGSEPSIVAPRLSAPSRLAASGAIPSRPSPLPAPHTNTAAFWVKLGIGGLVLLIGFIGWSVYVLTNVKVVTQLPTGQGITGAPAAVTAAPAPAAPPASAPLQPLVPSTASPAAASSDGSASTERPRDDADLQRRIEALEKQLAGQRSRAAARAAASRAGESAPAGTASSSSPSFSSSGWIEPSRPPTMTSAPGYQDAGPPVVRGPEPSVAAETRPTAPAPVVVAPSGAPSAASTTPAAPARDLGPPVVEGPGPRYDFSRQGGSAR